MRGLFIQVGATIGSVLLGLGLMLHFFPPTEWVDSQPRMVTYLDVYDTAWDDACRLSRYDCGDVERATIMYQYLSGSDGTYYCGRDVVLSDDVNPLVGAYQYSTLVHEFVHYLQVYHHGVVCPFLSSNARCLYEEEAWGVMVAVFEERGGDVDDLEDFHSLYRCPRLIQ